MRVVVLTGSRTGTASAVLPILAEVPGLDVALVILSEGQIRDRRKHLKQKLRKIWQIGPLGAYNGIRMRSWYQQAFTQLKAEPLDAVAQRFAIPFERVPSTNSAETVAFVKDAKPDLALSLGNGYIASRVFSLPTHGMLNVHHEVLPDYQGAQSVIWQLYNGSRSTGFTIHEIDDHIDTGRILYQENMPIEFRNTLADTVSHNYSRLVTASGHALARLLTNYPAFLAAAQAQKGGRKYTTPSFWQYRRIVRQYEVLRDHCESA